MTSNAIKALILIFGNWKNKSKWRSYQLIRDGLINNFLIFSFLKKSLFWISSISLSSFPARIEFSHLDIFLHKRFYVGKYNLPAARNDNSVERKSERANSYILGKNVIQNSYQAELGEDAHASLRLQAPGWWSCN